MRELIRPILLVAAIAAAGSYGWRWLFPDDEAEIAAVLDRIAGAVHAAEGEGDVGRLARAAQLRRELARDVIIDAGPPFRALKGREAIIGTAARMNGTVRDLELRFPDLDITVAPDRATAVAYVTAEARFREPGGGRGLDARELEIGFTRPEGDWVIARVALVRPLQRLDGQ